MARGKSSTKSIPIVNNTNSTSTNSVPKFDITSFFNFQNVTFSFTDIFMSIFKIINSILMGISYILLVFQTVYVLNAKQPKYINLRHVALKWLACIFLHQIKRGFSNSVDFNSQMTIIIVDLIIIAIAYPSRALKAVHLKYFSHKQQQRYQDSVTDPTQYDITFSSKIFISVAVVLLRFCKHLIAFVLPQHRRPIQDALRNLNSVVIDRKCFWSIYNNGSNEPTIQQKDKTAIKQYLVSGTTLGNSNIISPNNVMGSMPMYNSQIPQSNKQSKQIIKAYGEKYSNIITNGFKPIKRVAIKYMIFESKLEILDLDFAKSQTYILQQLTEKQGNVLQFVVLSPGQTQSEPIYIKFKNARELETFMKAIQQAQKVF